MNLVAMLKKSCGLIALYALAFALVLYIAFGILAKI